jgi:sterol desaturase/sphingolipid hydroxylase (fatty acid hydroxylase superfamily)
MIFYDLCNHKVVDVVLLRLYNHHITTSPFRHITTSPHHHFTTSPHHHMDKPIDYIALSIPIFFLLIGLELLISRLKHTQLYRFNDAITNISCGIGQQVIGVFLKTFTVLGYVFIYQNYRLIPNMPQNALTWVLLFIGVDFFYYWFHRLAHEINVLWGSHVVHHQSEEYNLSVALRQSWVQSVFSSLFYLPLAYIGFSPVLFVTIAAFQTCISFGYIRGLSIKCLLGSSIYLIHPRIIGCIMG